MGLHMSTQLTRLATLFRLRSQNIPRCSFLVPNFRSLINSSGDALSLISCRLTFLYVIVIHATIHGLILHFPKSASNSEY